MYAIPDDVLADLYPFGSGGSDLAVRAYIDQADKDIVLNIMLDLLLGEAFSTHYMSTSHEFDEAHTVINIAKAEGIDIDQFRADLEKPVDATPVKRPTLTLKKKADQNQGWPFQTQKESAGAA